MDTMRIAKAMHKQLMRLTADDEVNCPSAAPEFAGPVPKCFTPHQYTLWRMTARQINPGLMGPCTDCTPERHRQMLDEWRCERPLVRFRVDADGMIEGYYPWPRTDRHDAKTAIQDADAAD